MQKALISVLAFITLTLSSASASTLTWNLGGSTSQLLGVSDTLISTTGNTSLIFNAYSLPAQKTIRALQLMTGSVQSGEGFDTRGSNTALSSAPEPSPLGLFLIIGIVLIAMTVDRKPSGRRD